MSANSNGYVGFDLALFIAEKLRAQFVFDMAQMEGNTATYPQVETIVCGTSVAGLSVSETRQIDNINRGWQALIEDLRLKRFQINKLVAIEYNKLVSESENRLGFGGFRNELVARCQVLEDNPLEQSLLLYAEMARNQFFGDGNKRTALLMMNGNLIQNGLCPITITKSREVEYWTALIGYYESPEQYLIQFFDFLKQEQQIMLKRWGYKIENLNDTVLGKTINTNLKEGFTKHKL